MTKYIIEFKPGLYVAGPYEKKRTTLDQKEARIFSTKEYAAYRLKQIQRDAEKHNKTGKPIISEWPEAKILIIEDA